MTSFATAALLAAHDAALGPNGVTIRYRRGDQSTPEFKALEGKTDAETFDRAGLATTIELQDWILRADRLLGMTPQRGDLVDVIHDGQVSTFAVTHPNGSQPPYRRSDASGAILRIHSLIIDTPAEDEDPGELGE